jgi:hypothetical protein
LYPEWRLSIRELANLRDIPIVFTQYRKWESDAEKRLISNLDTFDMLLGKKKIQK